MKTKRDGSALPIVLGFLLAASVLVFTYALSARTERLVSRQACNRTEAIIIADATLDWILDYVLVYFDNRNGQSAAFDRNFQADGHYVQRDVFSNYQDDGGYGTAKNFLHSDITNYVPAALHPQMLNCWADWSASVSVDEITRKTSGTNALLTYAVIDLSGFLDATTVTSNQIEWLAENTGDITDSGLFINDRALHTAHGDASSLSNYISLRDLTQRNRGISPQPRNLLHYSFSPPPDVTLIGGNAFGRPRRDEMRTKQSLAPKFDVNSLFGDKRETHELSELQTDELMQSAQFDLWLREVTNRLTTIGFAASKEIAYSLLNFMDHDRIPQSDAPAPWQNPWPVEDVPLINEIAVAQVPEDFDSVNRTNTYAVMTELWFPFVTNSISPSDNAWLVTAAYTNWPPPKAVTSAESWTNRIFFDPKISKYAFVYSNRIEQMRFATDTEYLTCVMPEPYVTFPVTIREAVNANLVFNSGGYVTTTGDNLRERTLNLPLGSTVYSTFIRDNDLWRRISVTVTNQIRLISRVSIDGNWVDEAMAYDPNVQQMSEPYVFLEPCGFEIDDPRRNNEPVTSKKNGESGCWRRYPPNANPTFGTTNSICNPWKKYGQGIPIVHFNAPLTRAGDIGYIYEPYCRFLDGSSETSSWRSITLADPRPTATYSNMMFASGSVLDFFTTRCATNHGVRGLINPSTPWPDVVGAIFADMRLGHGVTRAQFSDPMISWMTNVFADIQTEMFRSELAIPVGVGDICTFAGMTESFAESSALDANYDTWHWRDCLGSETKEDVLREIAERVSFRQQIYLIVISVNTTTRSMIVSARKQYAFVVLRDAFSGNWRILSRFNIAY